MFRLMMRALMTAVALYALWTPGPAMASVDLVNWDNVVANTGSGRPATAEEIKRAFLVGGAKRGWNCADAAPGAMVCTLNVRTHTLVMDLAYEDGKYSLKYKSSINLDYRDQAGRTTIHRAYINWNTNLMNDARAELVRL